MMISKITFTFVFLFSSLIWHTDAFSMDASDIWKSYQELHLKEYTKSEIDNKLTTFHESAAFIVEHNIEADLKKHSFWIGLNHFSHMNETEREKLLNCFRDDDPSEVTPAITFNRTVEGIPENYDCREMNMVTSVKDQQGCGACWIFAALVSLEGQWKKVKGILHDLSEQNCLDCIKFDGCEGGLPSEVYSYVKENDGVDTYMSYPYEGMENECRFKKENVGATCSSSEKFGNENDMQLAVYERGPISVAVYASDRKFQNYKHGVYDSRRCTRTVNHAVGVVGFGTDDASGKPYWIVKNSYGRKWGDKGYIKIVRNKSMCSIDTMAEIVVV